MKKIVVLMSCITILGASCSNQSTKTENFQWQIDRFADIKVLRYQVPGFDQLTLEQKKLIYYLSQAAVCGRDILFDQNYKYNLLVRRTLEAIYEGYVGNRKTDDFTKFEEYLKRVWFSNGIHHHYSTDKFTPAFTATYFDELVQNTPQKLFPQEFEKNLLVDIIFNPEVAPKRVSQDPSHDFVLNSACHFYEGVTQKEAEDFYAKMLSSNDPTPPSYGLNSRLVKENGALKELVWKEDGLYGAAISKIVYWLKAALAVAENDMQRQTIESLISYYKTGNLREFDHYNILWLNDTLSRVDFVNGFTETYGDPLGYKATWESLVNFRDEEATKRALTITDNAQWFEDHSPVDTRFKKKEVKGVSAKVITAAMLGGDCYPATPIGINLPNADWIRKEHGSKSVTIENITYAYDQAAMGSGSLEEFAYSKEEIERTKKFGALAGNLNTDLHECLGHGSGQLLPNVKGDELKNYGSTLEEARADLFALYYIADPKMITIGLFDSLDVAWAEYDSYIRNALLVQLARIDLGKNVEEAHMRNRKLIAEWCLEKGAADKVIERKERDGKTFFVINDYQKLRTLFGELLSEIQRIKSEGDYAAGRQLVEQYAVRVDPTIHRQVLERYSKLNLAPYTGFVNPQYTLVTKDNEIVDIKISYTQNYVEQMLEYSKNYSFLPTLN